MTVDSTPMKLRNRLTIGFTAAVSLALGVFALTTYLIVKNGLWNSIDNRLIMELDKAQTVAGLVFGKTDLPKPLDYTEEAKLRHWFSLRDSSGKLIYTDRYLPPAYIAGIKQKTCGSEQAKFGTWSFSGRMFRTACRQYSDSEGGGHIDLEAFYFEDDALAALTQLLTALLLGTPVVILTALIAGFWLSGQMLAPIRKIADQFKKVSAENFKERIEATDSGDEIGSLSVAFNQMIDRLDRSFAQLRQFTAEVSHELRTPLTAMRISGQVGLSKHGTDGPHARIIQDMLEELERLQHLINTLLTISRLETSYGSIRKTNFDLLAVAREVVEHLTVLAEEKNQILTLDNRSGSDLVRITADASLIRLVVTNFLDNAIKFSPTGGKIDICILQNESTTMFSVADTGPGISESERGVIFERFFQGKSGSKSTGVGLGLAISRKIVTAHGGTISCDDAPAGGSVFTVTLPVSST